MSDNPFLDMAGLAATAPASAAPRPSNNPGNLLPGFHKDGTPRVVYPGQTGVDPRGIATFDTPEAGAAAQAWQLQHYQEKAGHPLTFRQIANLYAPRGHGSNDPDAYAAATSAMLGARPDDPIDLSDPAAAQRLAAAHARVEGNGGGTPSSTALPQSQADAHNPFLAMASDISDAAPGAQRNSAPPDHADQNEGLGRYLLDAARGVGEGASDFGVGLARGVTDVGGTVGWGIDKLGRATGLWNQRGLSDLVTDDDRGPLQKQFDAGQDYLAGLQYDPNGIGAGLGRVGGEMFATAPLSELQIAARIGLAGKAGAAVRLGEMSAQGGLGGLAASGGHDVLHNAEIGAIAAPAFGVAAEKIALPAAMRAYAAGKAIGSKVVNSPLAQALRDRIGASAAEDATAAGGAAGRNGWTADDLARGWRQGVDGQPEWAPSPTIRKGSEIPPEGVDADGVLHVNIEPNDAPQAASESSSGLDPVAIRGAHGSRGAKAGLESTTDLPPAVMQHVERLTAEGIPLEQAIREADITFVGGKPTIATVTRDPTHQAAANEGAKLLTPEGLALNARHVDNNRAVTQAMQGLVDRYGGTPGQGDAAEGAARALAAASDAERAKVSRLYRAADEEAASAKEASDLKTMAAQREADRNAAIKAQQQSRADLDAAQQALRDARKLPGSTGAADVDKARAGVAAARDKLRKVTDNPPTAAAIGPTPGAGYIDLAPLRVALNQPELVNPTIEGGNTLRSGTLGLMDAYGNGSDLFTLDQAERIRQAIGNAYDPMGGGINHHVGSLKGVLDQAMDSTDAGPSFKAARAAHRAWASAYDDPEGVGRLIRRDAQGNFASADDWRKEEGRLTGGISDRALLQIMRQLKTIGATGQVDRIKAAILQRGYEAASRGALDAGGNAVASGTKWFEALNSVGMPKLQAVFSPDELAEIAAVGRAASHLHEPAPGTNNTSNTASALANQALAQRMLKGVAASRGKKPGGAGVHVATTAGGAIASALGHTVAGPVASVAISGGKLMGDALRKHMAEKATRTGLLDAMDPAAARAAAKAAEQRTEEAARRHALARALAPHAARSGAFMMQGHPPTRRQRDLAEGLKRALVAR